MFTPRCARGDYLIEVRSLSPSSHSVGSSYWIRQVGAPEQPSRGPFDTLPDATQVALALAQHAGSRVWRRIAIYLEDGGEPTIELIGPGGGGGSPDGGLGRGRRDSFA